jgi:hypothetical protein
MMIRKVYFGAVDVVCGMQKELGGWNIYERVKYISIMYGGFNVVYGPKHGESMEDSIFR